MDFITNIPKVDGYDDILTLVCTLSKIAHFIPCNLTVKSRQLAELFLDNAYRFHGLPIFLVSDRDTRYTNHFFKNLILELKTILASVPLTTYNPMGIRKDVIALLNTSYVRSFILTISFDCLAYLMQNSIIKTPFTGA
jgi:hypothetical protein